MRLGWGARQILVPLLVAATLILIMGLLELASVVRVASEGAAVESGLITQTLLLQIGEVVQKTKGDPAQAVRKDRRVDLVLQAATAQAPSVVFVAICDTSGVVIVHSTPDMIGRKLDPIPPLPRISGLRQSIRLLAHLRGSPPVYGVESPLRLGGAPFATIRVGIAGGLIRERVDAVLHRGVLVAIPYLLLAVALGVGLAAILRGRLRQIEEGVAALREGRFDSRIPDSGVDEFSRLARDLNLLSEQFEKERQGQGVSLRRTVELLGDGILTLGPERDVVLVNGPAERVLGLQKAAIGRSLDEILPDTHPVRRLADRLYREGATSLSVALPGNGSNSAHVAVGHRISGQDGPGGVLIEIKETAALQQLHSLVDHSRVISRLGQMAAGVAHEIRNPLQSINLELAILRGARELSTEEIGEHVRSATEEIQRLQRAVSGFLRVARLQRMSFAALRAEELLEEVHGSHEAEANLAGLDLELVVEGELPRITGDHEVLRQALQNLVRNAIQAQPSREKRVVLRGTTQAGEVLLSVEDTGPGIPPENLEKVFDLYYTTKADGSGVGLALVRQAVEMHSGAVDLRSQPGKGTVVTMRLPVQPIHGQV